MGKPTRASKKALRWDKLVIFKDKQEGWNGKVSKVAWQGKISESLSKHSWWGAQKIMVWWWVLSVTEFRDRRGWSQSRLTSLMWSCTEADYGQHKCHAATANFLGLTLGPAEPVREGLSFCWCQEPEYIQEWWIVVFCSVGQRFRSTDRCCSRQNQRQGIHWDPTAYPSLIPSPPKALLPLVLPSETVSLE